MHHAQAGRLHPRADPRSIVSFGEARSKEIRDERVHRDALRGGSRLEPLVEILVQPGDELLHGRMIADAPDNAIIQPLRRCSKRFARRSPRSSVRGIDGTEATWRILAEHPDIVMFLVSTYERAEWEPKAVECGAAAYIPKSSFGPFELEEAWAQATA